MNYVVADTSFKFEDIINFPFVCGSYGNKYGTAKKAIEELTGDRIQRATTAHVEILHKLLNACNLPSIAHLVCKVEDISEILLYEPAKYNQVHAEELTTPNLAVYIPNADMYANETVAFWEHPCMGNVDLWLLRGRYYGYPDCCIQTFIERANAGPMHPQWEEIAERSKDYPCLLCDHHASFEIHEMEAVVQAKRHSPFVIDAPEQATPAGRIIDTLSYFLALQEGKLSMQYNFGDQNVP